MGLFCVKLVAFACADNFHRVVQCCWPVESLSESFSDQGARCSMVSIDSGVYLKKKFLALGNGNTLYENASFRQAVFVELAVDYGECFGWSGNPASCVCVPQGGPRGGDKPVGRPSNLCCLHGLSQIGL